MNNFITRTLSALSAALTVAACGGQSEPGIAIENTNSIDLSSCIRTVMNLDQGRWNYVGAIARVNGTVREYRATSVHEARGEDLWSSKSFGGDVGGTEDAADITLVTLDGNRIVPIEDDQFDEDAALDFQSCEGPDPEGRYQAEIEYKIPVGDGSFDFVKNVSWYGQQGTYFAEDHFNAEGRIIARRSGVYLPVTPDL